jgi:hypothetical protein
MLVGADMAEVCGGGRVSGPRVPQAPRKIVNSITIIVIDLCMVEYPKMKNGSTG